MLQEGLAAALAGGSPDAALRLFPGYGPALSRAAEQRLARADGAAPAQGLAVQALAREPLDVRALRVLALGWARRGRPERADAAMSLAGARSLRDTPAHVWLFARRLLQGRPAAALHEADGLARRDPALWPAIFPAMIYALRTPQGVQAITPLLAARPIWRPAFLADLDAAAPTRLSFHLLQALAATGPLNLEEASPYFVRRTAEAPLDQVWLEWVALLPPSDLARLRYLYDGGFSGPRAPPPFDWSLPVQPGALTQIDAHPEDADDPALLVGSDGGRETTLASQIVVLPPGRYRVSLEAEVDPTPDPGRFALRLECRQGEAGARLGETTLPDGGAWRAAALQVDVPAACPAQAVVILGRPGIGAGRAQARIDDVAVQRLPSAGRRPT